MPRIIIAENNKSETKLYSELIAPLGYDYILFQDGESVVEEFRKEPGDLVIVDHNLPGKINGIDVCRKIRQESEGITVPLIIVSAKDDEDLIMEALDAGASDYLLKPFAHNHFIAKVKSYINFYALHQKDSVLVKNKSKFAGRYLIQKLIGCGSHSSIFLAEDLKGEYGHVAIKLLMESASEEHFASAFIDIANKFKKLDSENIIRIFDSGQYAGRLFLVMEYAGDGDLASILKRKTLSDYDTAELLGDIAKGIKILKEHKIVHFDIKPENIMLNGHTFQLADFGIIPPQKKRTVSLSSNDIWTTLSYVAPEYLDPDFKNVDSDESCDIYSLGVTAYEAFTGMNPFEANKAVVSISKQINLIPHPLTDFALVNSRLSNLVDQMLCKNPEDRPSSEEVIAAVDAILEAIKDMPPVFGKHRQEIHEREIAADSESQTTEIPPEHTVHRHVPSGKTKIDPFAGSRNELLGRENAKKQKIDLTSGMQKAGSFLLLIAIIACVMVAGYGIFTYATKTSYKETRGAMRVTICSGCKHKEQRNVVDIAKLKCSKCKKAKLHYVMFCNNCGYEFPFKREQVSKKKMSKEEMLNHLSNLNRCPRCNSSNTQPAMTDADLMRKLKEFKAKKGK